MRVWRRTRTEMAGAWRSLRYDMGRRPSDPPAGGPDVTSTGMSTFGGTSWDFRAGPEPTEMPIAGRMPRPRRRGPRRAVTVSAFGLLTVAGAAGAYLVVVNGLVPLREQGPAAAATVPPAATAEAALGPAVRPATRVAKAPRTGTAIEPRRVTAPGRTLALPPAPPDASPLRTTKGRRPPTPECACGNPPVPTPTAPASSPSPTPSAPAEPSATASGSSEPTGNPSESVEARNSHDSDHYRHYR